MVWDIFVERVRRPQQNERSDEAVIAAAVRQTDRCIGVLESLLAGDRWLAGETLSLADLHAAPMIAYLRAAPEGATLMAQHPSLAAWWERIAARPSMQATPSPLIPDPGDAASSD